jgi:hypothetical protein
MTSVKLAIFANLGQLHPGLHVVKVSVEICMVFVPRGFIALLPPVIPPLVCLEAI